MLDYILFDMDNCLYPASTGLGEAINENISIFVAQETGMTLEEAREVRRANIGQHGTTLNWLKSCRGFTDIEEYNRRIHPVDINNYLETSAALVKMLENLPCRASILTNAPAEHAGRVLSYLGIEGYFENVMDIGFNGYRGKPYRETFLKALDYCGVSAGQTLFIDDVPDYLIPFRDLGGTVLLVDEENRHSRMNLPRISSILELPEWWEQTGSSWGKTGDFTTEAPVQFHGVKES